MPDTTKTNQISSAKAMENRSINFTIPAVIVILQLFILWIDSITPLGIAIGIAYVFPVLLSLLLRSTKLTIIVAGSGSVLTILGIFISPGALAPTGVYLINRSLSVAAIIITAYLGIKQNNVQQEQLRLNQELSLALANVRTLKGLLPICANCKKIRNDSGMWEQIETYVKENSDADFSHGICPDCMHSLYPDITNRIETI